MSIRKFIAPTARQAMKEIRDELGSDAMILSNRKTERGVEIVAIANGDFAHLTGDAVAQKTEWPEITADEWTKSVAEASSGQPARPLIQTAPALQPRQPLQFQHKAAEPAGSLQHSGPLRLSGALRHPGKPQQPERVPAPQVNATRMAGAQPVPAMSGEKNSGEKNSGEENSGQENSGQENSGQNNTGQENILSEIKSMSAMLQQQFATLYWNDVQLRDPQRAGLLRKMLNAGFSTLLARQLLDNMPAGEVQGEAWIKQVFKRNLQVAGKADDIIAKGGVYALIGPTGVGKTTTTAKLAARAVEPTRWRC